jgi:trans-aconitate methyltransferase
MRTSQSNPSAGDTLRPVLRSLLEQHVSQRTVALDLGCGGGRIIRLLQSLGIPDNGIYGLDNDPALINIARNKFPNVNFIHHELTETPYHGIPNRVNIATAHFGYSTSHLTKYALVWLRCDGSCHKMVS